MYLCRIYVEKGLCVLLSKEKYLEVQGGTLRFWPDIVSWNLDKLIQLITIVSQSSTQ